MITQFLEASQNKWTKVLIGLAVALVLCFLINVALGSVTIPFESLISFITSGSSGQGFLGHDFE